MEFSETFRKDLAIIQATIISLWFIKYENILETQKNVWGQI